jgi:anti-sigma regulatory factor (Ser/Thr protein kinase)
MNVVRLLALLVFTFGAFAYGAMLALWIREVGRGWTGTTGSRSRRGEAELIGGALLGVSFAWFFANLVLTLWELGPLNPGGTAYLLVFWLALAFPPLIMHVTYLEVMSSRRRAQLEPPGAAWRLLLWGMYAAAHGIAIAVVQAYLAPTVATGGFIPVLADYSIGAAFIIAAVYSLSLMSSKRPPRQTTRERQSRRWILRLFGLMVPLFALLVVLSTLDGSRAMPVLAALLDVTARSLPLMFIFVGTYYESRFEFFDIFVKRGLSLLITIGLLTLAFAVALPLLRPLGNSWAAPWIYAVCLLPIVGVLPWLHARVAATLDRRWLGRRFRTVEAVKRFLAGLKSATAEPQLVAQAEAGFAEIFGAPARVLLHAADADVGFEAAQQIPIRSNEVQLGRVLLGRRPSEMPYFGDDVALASSLADVLASWLDHLRLQVNQREQAQLARDMALQASRSELKALRAQINPHFLFNALNAIAGLIHRDPAEADRTVEQLADVFRYALRGSLEEWARLEDELAFVRAYLAVEQARFGSRLDVDVRLDPTAAGAKVPTLAIQTLVENALKHGVAAVRGQARVEIDARTVGDRLVISVADNGPGPKEVPPRPAGPAGGAAAGGVGLDNVRRRLAGYFGAAASLDIRRDTERAMTVATIALPHPAGASAATVLAEERR